MNASAANSSQIDLGLRSYMPGVYNHMTTALLLTGFFAYATKMLATTTGPNGQMYRTPLVSTLFNTQLQWVVMLAPLGMVVLLSALVQALSAHNARNRLYLAGGMRGGARRGWGTRAGPSRRRGRRGVRGVGAGRPGRPMSPPQPPPPAHARAGADPPKVPTGQA